MKDTSYDLSEIKYNDKQCNIVFLEQTGFYSYIYNRERSSVEFLFTYYDGFETRLLGEENLPSEIINSFFGDNCFWFRMHNPETDGFNQIYYSWNVDTHKIEIADSDDIARDYEYSIDNNRSKDYSFSHKSNFTDDILEITDNKTGVVKRIDKSVLNTFDEGRKILAIAPEYPFNISRVFERDGDVYFITFFEVDFLGDPSYYYIVKWNFETEECDFYTSLYFETFQKWIDDMYFF